MKEYIFMVDATSSEDSEGIAVLARVYGWKFPVYPFRKTFSLACTSKFLSLTAVVIMMLLSERTINVADRTINSQSKTFFQRYSVSMHSSNKIRVPHAEDWILVASVEIRKNWASRIQTSDFSNTLMSVLNQPGKQLKSAGHSDAKIKQHSWASIPGVRHAGTANIHLQDIAREACRPARRVKTKNYSPWEKICLEKPLWTRCTMIRMKSPIKRSFLG